MTNLHAARNTLLGFVSDAIARADLPLTVAEASTVEGSFVLVADHVSQSPLCLFEAITPETSAYDDVARDRARSIAARVQAPLVAVTNFRRLVCYNTDAITRRLPDDEQHVASFACADVCTLADVSASAASVSVTDALRRLLLDVVRKPDTWSRGPVAERFFSDRITGMLDDMISCTDGSAEQRNAAIRVGTSVLAYGLLHTHRHDVLDRLRVPYGIRSARLLLDIVGGYLREARACGFTMFPKRIDGLHVQLSREPVFRGALEDLVNFIERFGPDRLVPSSLHRGVDAILQWCAETQRRAVPTLDAIDLAIRAAAHNAPLSSATFQAKNAPARPRTTSTATPHVLEMGDTMGLFSVRTLLRVPQARAYVYAPTLDDERTVLLRSSGQLDEPSDICILRSHEDIQAKWDVVCISSSEREERHRLRLLLTRLPLAEHGTIVLFLPMSVLHDPLYASVRTALVDRFEIQWVIVSDDEPLSKPDAGLCCIVGVLSRSSALAALENGSLEGASGFDGASAASGPLQSTAGSLSRFVCIRRPLSTFFPTSSATRELDGRRTASVDAFVKYLDASERGKLNEEALVRMVPQRVLRELANSTSGAWEDFVVPPDVLASILRKAQPLLRPLADIAEVHGGIRTGASDVLIADAAQISSEGLEMRFWQRTIASGAMVDNLIITSADDLVSVAGLPNTDKRLLRVSESYNDLENTHMQTRIERAEREGVQTRPSVRGRDPWYDVGEVASPSMMIPKNQDGRWIVAMNPAHAYTTDACVGITLRARTSIPTSEHTPLGSRVEAIAAWLNSTMGLFMCELSRRSQHVQDVTVRDAEGFPIPIDTVLDAIDLRAHRDFMRRPVKPLSLELGSGAGDSVAPTTVLRDRRRLDVFFMQTIFALTPEEERWVYRFAHAWQRNPANLRHHCNALVSVLESQHRIKPLHAWYTPAIEQLPDDARRVVLLPDGITRAESVRTMFTWQMVGYKGAKSEEIIDCSSQEEAEILALFADLGKKHVEIPTDPLLIAALLPDLRRFRTQLDTAMIDALALAPEHLRAVLAERVRGTVTRF